MTKSDRKKVPITTDELWEASKGIHYRYFQFKNSIFVLPFASINLSSIYNNALVESFAINLRCLLEFFKPGEKTRYTNIQKPSRSVFVEDYFDQMKNNKKDSFLYQQIFEIWNSHFVIKNPNEPIKFKCQDAFTKKDVELSLEDVYEQLHAHVAHQGIWNIKPNDYIKGRISYKISNWYPHQFYPGIRELVKTWYTLLKNNKPELLHEDWNDIKDSDF